MKIVFLWVLSWSAHPSLVRKCCSLRTLLSISNNTITLYRREFSLNIRGMTVIGTYSSKLDTVLYILCWHSTYPAMKQVLSYITYNNMEWVILLHWISSFKVENDVLLNMEKDRVTVLTLLDLSAVFDTIDIVVWNFWYSAWLVFIVLERPMSTGKNVGLYYWCGFYIFWCTPGLCRWTYTFYLIYWSPQSRHRRPWCRTSSLCRWHTNLYISIRLWNFRIPSWFEILCLLMFSLRCQIRS